MLSAGPEEREMKQITICAMIALLLGLSAVLYSPLVVRTKAAPNTAYLFIEVETKVYRKGIEISSENPEERRWYMSNVVEQPDDVPTYSLIKQKVMPYFSRNVMDPVEARGFSLDYGDEDVKLNGDVSQANYETRAEAEQQRNKEIEYRKGQSGNIYSFEIVWSV